MLQLRTFSDRVSFFFLILLSSFYSLLYILFLVYELIIKEFKRLRGLSVTAVYARVLIDRDELVSIIYEFRLRGCLLINFSA